MFNIRCKQLWSNQLLRFFVVGIGNTLFGYLAYLIGLWLGLSYQQALAGATIFGAIFNFFTTGRIVFGSRALHRIFGFLAVYAVVLVVNLLLLTWLIEAGITKAYAQAILLPIVVVLSFLLNKYAAFGSVS